jgi:heme exporter protein C
MTFLAFFLVLVFSLKYLWKSREEDDLLAASSAEVGTAFNGLTLVIGSIWAKPTWGVWWAWDARLTSTLVLFLIFVGYLSLRAYVDDPHRRAQWSAAVGILGAINVPIVYMSVR